MQSTRGLAASPEYVVDWRPVTTLCVLWALLWVALLYDAIVLLG